MLRTGRLHPLPALSLALTLLAVGAAPSQERAYFAVRLTTLNMLIPGAPGLPAGVDLEQLPPQVRQQLAGLFGPRRELTVRLLSPGEAPPNAQARLDIPPGLKLGPTLPLEILRPAERRRQNLNVPEPPGGRVDMEIRHYWGCAETVPAGQPRVMRIAEASPAQRALYERLQRRQAALERPDWTEAVWPNQRNEGPPAIAPDASIRGDHTLRTNYAGEARFTVTPPVDFLEPVTFTSPDARRPIDLKRAIPLAWRRVANALGYQLLAVGMRGRNTLILWTAAPPEQHLAIQEEFPETAVVREAVAKGALLRPETTACSVPAGIFDGCEPVMVLLTAFGPGQAFEGSGPAVRVQTRSLGQLTIGQGFGEAP